MTYLEEETAAQAAKIKALEDEVTVINEAIETMDGKINNLTVLVNTLTEQDQINRHNILVLQEATRGMKLYKQVTNQEAGDGFYLDPNFIRQDVDEGGAYPEFTMCSLQRTDNPFLYDNKWLLK